MEQKGLTIERRSNLLANPKTGQANSIQKQSQARIRGSFFGGMLQSIKSTLARERALKDEQEYEQRQRQQKQNNGIVVEARHLKQIDPLKSFLSLNNNRANSGNSRSFLIRSHLKKPIASSIDIKPVRTEFEDLLITPKNYDLNFLKELAQPVSLHCKINPVECPCCEWGILVPARMIGRNISFYTNLFSSYIDSNVITFIVATSKQEKQRLCESLGSNCRIICSEGKQKGTQYTFLNLEDIQLPINLIVFETTQYPYTRIFPFLGADRHTRLSFIKIRELSRVKSFSIISNQVVLLKVSLSEPKTLRKKEEDFDLGSHAKMEIESLRRRYLKRRRTRISQNLPTEPSADMSLPQLQQKLLQYVKILKSELKTEDRPSRTSKTPFQVINQLIRGNAGCHRQIQDFIQQAKNVEWEEPVCGGVTYTCIE